MCDGGFGAASDVFAQVGVAKIDCSERVCPFGPSWASLPASATSAHPPVECSDSGTCDRQLGACQCFEGFEGPACQRRLCPGGADCSGHGRCVEIRRMTQLANAEPLTTASGASHLEYGALAEDVAWDATTLQGCVCDSSWAVGFASGETQSAEWFGPDCSSRHCPTGNDPRTYKLDETICEGGVEPGSGYRTKGAAGNLCHVDCSNRGVCDHDSGVCSCFDGFYSENCGLMVGYHDGVDDHGAAGKRWSNN